MTGGDVTVLSTAFFSDLLSERELQDSDFVSVSVIFYTGLGITFRRLLVNAAHCIAVCRECSDIRRPDLTAEASGCCA